MNALRRVCVFCGSSPGARGSYAATAARLGRLLAERGLTLVYGGGHVGLMGAVADAAMDAGGEVIGVIPEHLERREVAHLGVTDLRVVDSMHTRKALFEELSDGFIALPGGLGTYEELFEILTWGQLGLHAKPVGLLDVDGFYAPLQSFLDHAVEERFVHTEHRSMLLVDHDAERLLDRMAAWQPPVVEKWLDRERT
jgi:uncharacterized protein (TIGR00730 family)